MSAERLELSATERRVATASLIVVAVGEFGLRAVGNASGVWWPSIALGAVFMLFALGFAMHLAKSRHRSLGSVVVLGLPERLRRRRGDAGRP